VSEAPHPGAYRFQCLEAVGNDVCAVEGRLLELLGIRQDDIRLGRGGDGPDGPVFIDLRDTEIRDIEWVDRPFLPWGELVTNNADGDTGKGLYAVHEAARVSRGEFG